MMRKETASEETIFQFVVLPNTGLQLCRNFPVPRALDQESLGKIFERAKKSGDRYADDEVVRMLAEHLSVQRLPEENAHSPWFRCDDGEDLFWRLSRHGSRFTLDLVVDTNRGAGQQFKNKVVCQLPKSILRKKQEILGSFYVEAPAVAGGVRGSLIVDFGNSGTTAIFSPIGKGASRDTIVQLQQPLDPFYRKRNTSELTILHSNLCFLRVPKEAGRDPWIVSGERARELVLDEPMTTYIFAPKKYIRHWPEHLKESEPATQLRGVVGQRDGMVKMLPLVQSGIEHLLATILGRLVNPKFTSQRPECYPIIQRTMLTYPLTWRQADREVFQGLVSTALEKFTKYEGMEVDTPEVELICSEPVAVAAYIVWEYLFQFGVKAHGLVGSNLGNVNGDESLRLLVLDIGGGSTDIAMVEVNWAVQDGHDVDVSFQMVESMRFNRAGDRISHIIVTALLGYIRRKYGFDESLVFNEEPEDLRLTRAVKQNIISELTSLAELAKRYLSQNQTPWVLTDEMEQRLLDSFSPILEEMEDEWQDTPEPFTLSIETLEAWIRRDTQSLETNGEPGFMDVFRFMEELMRNLRSSGRPPHCIALTGRTCRLPLIRKLAIEFSGLPPHWVRTLDELLPFSASRPNSENFDKLAVVMGAHRFRFGDNVRFQPLPEEKVFNRYIGTVMDTPDGLKINALLVEPGDSSPRSFELEVHPSSDLRIGHCFRLDGIAEVIAVLSNPSGSEKRKVIIDVVDDFTIRLNKGKGVKLNEWLPGGNDIIVDNYNDTGNIDTQPEGFIERTVLQLKPLK